MQDIIQHKEYATYFKKHLMYILIILAERGNVGGGTLCLRNSNNIIINMTKAHNKINEIN